MPVQPDEKPKPTRRRLQEILAASSGRLPAAVIVAQVRAAGFEVSAVGPTYHEIAEEPPGSSVWPTHIYVGTCLCEGVEYFNATLTGVNEDPALQAQAQLLAMYAAIDRAAYAQETT